MRSDKRYGDLKAAVEIDRFNLEEECSRQPVLYMEAGEAAALARADYDKLKLGLEMLEAELDGLVRRQAESRGEKITEKVVSSKITLTADWQRHNEQLLKQKFQVELLDNLKDAYKTRGYALRDEVTLLVTGYYEGSGDGRKGSTAIARDLHADRNRERMAESRKSRRKL
jgi:hypothetical protein